MKKLWPSLLLALVPVWASARDPREARLEQWFWQAAQRLVGHPYLWGGNGTGGFDCSGLVVYIYRHLGRNLPRTSREQYAYLPPVPQGDRVRVGDLLFFSERGKGIDHVAIYIGKGYILHASGSSGKVVVDPWTKLKGIYVGARRPFSWKAEGFPKP